MTEIRVGRLNRREIAFRSLFSRWSVIQTSRWTTDPSTSLSIQSSRLEDCPHRNASPARRCSLQVSLNKTERFLFCVFSSGSLRPSVYRSIAVQCRFQRSLVGVQEQLGHVRRSELRWVGNGRAERERGRQLCLQRFSRWFPSRSFLRLHISIEYSFTNTIIQVLFTARNRLLRYEWKWQTTLTSQSRHTNHEFHSGEQHRPLRWSSGSIQWVNSRLEQSNSSRLSF